MKPVRQKARRKRFNKGRWEVEKERFRISDGSPPGGVEDATGIGDVVTGIMKNLGLEGLHWISILEEEWPKLVGDAVSKHSRPGRIEGKCLTVFVDSSVWLNELVRYGRKQMLENLQKKFGRDKIGSLRIALDPEGGSRKA